MFQYSVSFLFVALALLVYVWAGYLIVLTRLRRGQQTPRSVAWQRRIIFPVAAAGLVCTCYAYFIEPYWLEVSHVRITSPKLDHGRSFRIVQISDLHSAGTTCRESRVPALVQAEKPDLIVFDGDVLNDETALPVAKRMFRRLANIAPVYAVDGNWDNTLPQGSPYDGTGVRHLQNAVAEHTIRATPIQLIGTGTNHGSAMRVVTGTPGKRFTILLHHCPELIAPVAALGNVDLYLAGNTHGGQVVLPVFGSLSPLKPNRTSYWSGLYKRGSTYLYVNRGVGMERHLPFRFLARPEITVIDVTSTR